MKENLIAALAMLEGIAHVVPPGAAAEIQFKNALVALQKEIDAPAPLPETIVQTQVATDTMAGLVSTKINDVLAGVLARMTAVEAAAASVVTIAQSNSDKLDGMESVLGQVIADVDLLQADAQTIKQQTAPAPAPEPAPAA